MPVINIGESLTALFTWLKIGASLTVLILLITKLIDVAQETSNPELQDSVSNLKMIVVGK